MPASIAIGLIVLGGVLLLVAILGGNFKIFGAEVGEKVSSGFIRLLSGVLGIAFVFLALFPLQTGSASDPQPPAAHEESNKPPAASASTAGNDAAPQPAVGSSQSSSPVVTASPPAVEEDQSKSISKLGAAIVFDPPSNIRTAPSGTAPILCSVQTKRSINLMSSTGPWYATDACGGIGYIHQSQIKFSE